MTGDRIRVSPDIFNGANNGIVKSTELLQRNGFIKGDGSCTSDLHCTEAPGQITMNGDKEIVIRQNNVDKLKISDDYGCVMQGYQGGGSSMPSGYIGEKIYTLHDFTIDSSGIGTWAQISSVALPAGIWLVYGFIKVLNFAGSSVAIRTGLLGGNNLENDSCVINKGSTGFLKLEGITNPALYTGGGTTANMRILTSSTMLEANTKCGFRAVRIA